MNDEMWFDTDFMTEEEIQKMIDDAVIALGEQLRENELRTSIIDPDRMRVFFGAYKLLKYLTKGTKAKVKYEAFKPYKYMGVITVIGSPIKITNPELFIKAVGLASNFEVYTKTDGTVQMDFTFHGLTRPIE